VNEDISVRVRLTVRLPSGVSRIFWVIMAVVNTSYITDIDELAQFTDIRHVERIATTRDAADSGEPLVADRLDFTNRALNSAARWIENLWRKHYNLTDSGKIVDSVSTTDPSDRVKEWNARLAVNLMEGRRGNTEMTEIRQSLIDEIVSALASNSPEVFSDSRSQQILPSVVHGRGGQRGLIADDADQFGSVIPDSERRFRLDF